MAGLVPAIYSAHIAAGDVAEGAGVFARALDGLAAKRNVSKRVGSLYRSGRSRNPDLSRRDTKLITCDIWGNQRRRIRDAFVVAGDVVDWLISTVALRSSPLPLSKTT